MCTIPLLRKVCRESYNQPLEVYEKLKRLGMDLVTVTDHDSIDAVEALRSRPDFFLSEEVTCTLPSGNQLHMGVYDITERDHIELQRRRDDFESLLAWLVDQDLFFSANHIFSSLTGRRSPRGFPPLRNRLPRPGNTQRPYAGRRQCQCRLDGGLAPAPKWAAATPTPWRASGARGPWCPARATGRNTCTACAAAWAASAASTGSYAKLTRDVFAIGREMVRENPATLPIAALGWMVPFIILHNSIREAVFVPLVDGTIHAILFQEERGLADCRGDRVTLHGSHAELHFTAATTG